MNENKKKGGSPEIKVTVKLLLDTEEKIEKLQAEIDNLEKPSTPAYKFNPPGFGSENRVDDLAVKKAQLQGQIKDLTQRSLEITNLIEEGSTREIKQRIARLKEDWIKDMSPLKADEDKDFSKVQKKANRQLNRDWMALDQPTFTQTPFAENKDDITRKVSYLDQIRGLTDEYAHLSQDVSQPEPGQAVAPPNLEEPKADGPDIEIDEN